MAINRMQTYGMMRIILLTVLLWITGSSLWGQARTGIYLTIETDQLLCDHKMKLLNEQKIYCFSQEPILEMEEFESISDISYDSLFQMRQFNIRLTKRGGNYINTVATKLPDHKIGVVVDGILITVINLDGIYNARSIQIWDEFDSEHLIWIHKNLSNSLSKYHKKS